MSWQKHLKQLKRDYIKSSSPGFYELSGGDKMQVKSYQDQTANGLTNCIMDFLKFNGHYANRINSQGQARKEKIELAFGNYIEKVRFTHGTTSKGTADIMAIINGKHVAIEVKIGRDKMSQAQEKEQQRILSSGGLYFVAKDFTLFFEWFTKTFEHVPVRA
jgi:hypothetical protein